MGFNAILSFLSNIGRYIRLPLTAFQTFMNNNPATRTMRVFRAQGQQLRYLTSLPRQLGRQIIPQRFRTARKGGEAGSLEDVPEEDKARLAEFDRSRRRRRVRGVARKAAFSQIHLVERSTNQRWIMHIGSATGVSFAEWIINPGSKQAIVLQFWLADEAAHGAPLLLKLMSGPKDTTVTVDNKLVSTDMPIRTGSLLDVNGRIFDIQLVAYGDLPAVTRVDAAWETNVGPIRDINQDAIGIYQHPKAYMFTIADGVGGGYAGDEVSAFSVKYLLSVFKENIDFEHFSWFDVYSKAFAYVNAEVRNFVEAAPSAAGTTLTSVFIRNWTAYIAHVGDLRVYHLRSNSFQQVTTEHNKTVTVESRNRAGFPVKEERSVLQRAIGRRDDIHPEIKTIALQPNDMLLLTTDGVTNNVTDEEIYEILTTTRFTQIPNELVELSNSRNNKDNASAIVIQVLREAYDRDVWVADPSDRVYVGGPAWYLKLNKPTELNTMYSFVTQTGCYLMFLVLLIFTFMWTGRQVQRFADWATSYGEAVSTDAAESASQQNERDGITIITSTPRPTAEVQIILPTATETFTPIPTFTPQPTSTITPTDTATPTVTPITPTSTLRPR